MRFVKVVIIIYIIANFITYEFLFRDIIISLMRSAVLHLKHMAFKTSVFLYYIIL